MPEEFEQENLESIDWARYLGIARRRVWYFMVPLFIVWLAFWIASWLMPSIYRSSELIIVEPPAVSPGLVSTANVSGNLQDRLSTITQQILSRTRLLHIIDQFGLYSKERSHASPDELVERMKSDIDIELDRSSDHGQLNAFRIYYSSRDPYTAQQVTGELTNLFINENLEVTQTRANNDTKFLEGQLEQASQALAAQEEKVRLFNQQHPGSLPGQLQSNIEILRGLQSQLGNEQSALNAAKERNAYLQSLLEQYRALARSGRTNSDGTVTSGLPAIDQELDRLRAQLADLSSRYTDEYPDVRKVKDQIAKTERMRKQMEDQLKSAPPQAASSGTDYASAKDAGPTLELQSQLKANQIEINTREQAIKTMQARVTQYQEQLNNVPVEQQKLTEISRGYDQSKADYDALLKRKNESELATNYVRDQQGEHFSIQDPPNLPTKPDSPKRLQLFGMGLVAGIVLGAVCALAAEFLDHRIFSEAEFKRLVPAEVMVEIPPIPTPQEEHQEKRDARVRMATAGAIAACMVVALAITFLHG
ncbi:MAG TPA: XrtA system polysaccharide chain length determinant [Terriglobales bacterium]|nr:XrtA system polysaccharide chain length determinant [Terriglobales bacterium]